MPRTKELIRRAVRHSIWIPGGNVENVKLLAGLQETPKTRVVFRAPFGEMCRGVTHDRSFTVQIQNSLEKFFRSLLEEKARHLVVSRGGVFRRGLAVTFPLTVPAGCFPFIVVRTEPSLRILSGGEMDSPTSSFVHILQPYRRAPRLAPVPSGKNGGFRARA